MRPLSAGQQGIEAADLVTAYEATPVYVEQESTLYTQRGFLLLIGILVTHDLRMCRNTDRIFQMVDGKLRNPIAHQYRALNYRSRRFALV